MFMPCKHMHALNRFFVPSAPYHEAELKNLTEHVWTDKMEKEFKHMKTKEAERLIET